MPRVGRSRPFRAPLALAAALLVAACQVDVDGAPCRGPGSTADCPDGQACGNDLRCSARALACATSRCTPGDLGCDGTARAVVVCTAADPVCGRWEEVDACEARGMVCGTRGGPEQPACECPEGVPAIVVVEPGGSPSMDAYPFPRGQDSPRECRLGRLSDALAAAASRAPSAGAVLVAGEAGAPAIFGAATAESWPLTVAANVTLVGAPPPAEATVIRGEPGAAALLAVQGAVEGLRVEAGGATGTGLALSCGASGAPSLRRVTVEGGGVVLDPDVLGTVTAGLREGVTVSGTCGGRLSGVEVSRVAGPALTVSPDPASVATVDVLGGSFVASNVGISIRGQRVRVAPDPDTAAASTVVWGNSGEGVVIGGVPATAVEATLEGMIVTANGGTGIVMQGLTSASRVLARACDVSGNGEVRARKYGPQIARRTAGGVLVTLGAIAAFTFSGNRLWANASDQLAFESGATWSIAALSCGPDTNVFDTCMPGSCDYGGGGACAVASSSTGAGSVQLDNNLWPGTPLSQYVTSNIADLDATYCTTTDPGVPAKPTCPSP